MSRKLVIEVDGSVMAIKYSFPNEMLCVGGNTRVIEAIRAIMLDYWEVKRLPDPMVSARNKVRYEVNMKHNRFENGVALLRENGFAIEEVRDHGRIMR